MLKKSVVIKAGRIKPLKIKPDYKTIIMMTLLICGIIIGIAVFKNNSEELSPYTETLVNKLISSQAQASVVQYFSFVFTTHAVFVIILFIAGLCAVGLPLVFTVPVLFGFFCSFSICCFLANFGLEGLGYCAVVNIPSYAITAATIIKCCCESINMSSKLFNFTAGVTTDKKQGILLKEYALKYLIFCIPLIIGALLNTLAFKLFYGLFSFI